MREGLGPVSSKSAESKPYSCDWAGVSFLNLGVVFLLTKILGVIYVGIGNKVFLWVSF